MSVGNLKTSSFNMGSTASGATTAIYAVNSIASGLNNKKRKRIEFESAMINTGND